MEMSPRFRLRGLGGSRRESLLCCRAPSRPIKLALNDIKALGDRYLYAGLGTTHWRRHGIVHGAMPVDGIQGLSRRLILPQRIHQLLCFSQAAAVEFAGGVHGGDGLPAGGEFAELL